MNIKFSNKKSVPAKELFRQAQFDNILKCVHCGLCLESCPTYSELGDEKNSPRGRLYIMNGLWKGELDLEQSVIDPLNLCLNCRACENACPSGVPYGELLEKTRGIILENTPKSLKERLLRSLILKGLFRYTSMMILTSRILKIYAATGLPKLFTQTFFRKLLPKSFVFKQQLLPNFSGESFKHKHADKVLSPIFPKNTKLEIQKRNSKIRVGMFSGCILDVSEKEIHESTLTLLRHLGCEVIVPGNQSCCGAIHVHSGDRETAREFALKNFDAFELRNFDAIITNSAGCGAQLKEYHHLFSSQTQGFEKDWYAFGNKFVDILEFLSRFSDLLGSLSWSGDEDVVLYDAPCHLMYAQKVNENPQKLFNSMPGISLIPLKEYNWCCGSAGIYNLVQSELSSVILNRKTESIRETLKTNPKATTILTGNPGCLYQIRAGMMSENIDLRILHPVVYLAERLKK